MIFVSFYNSKINPEIVKYQKKIFDHFGIDIIQHEFHDDHKHGFAIDWWLKERWKYYGFENIAIFDIDCIPLSKFCSSNADSIVNQGFLYGAAQRANHIINSEIYCSPAFCCFSKEAYEEAGRPTFLESNWHDVGGFFTSELVRVGYAARLLWPTEVENPIWDLTKKIKFGQGTNYEDIVYHAFESRIDSVRFTQKCKKILNETD